MKSTNTKAKGRNGVEKVAIISVKEVKNAIKIMIQILEKLDEIYHALHDKENNSNGETYQNDNQ